MDVGQKNEGQDLENSESLKKQQTEAENYPYFLVDIGANLTHKKFSRDFDAVLNRCKDAGIQKIIVTGASLHTSKEALRLTRLYPGMLYCTAGVHPHDAKSWIEEESYNSLKEIASNPECVAIGECGLDFNRNFSPSDIQIKALDLQVQLACSLKKPLFVHEREGHIALVNTLKRHQPNLPPVVIHSFTGNVEEALNYLSLGCYIGITGYIWKDKSAEGIRKILEEKILPLDRLLIESDSPFMYPNTRASKISGNIKSALTEPSLNFLHRYCTFQRNEPCSLPVTLEMIAAYLKMKPEELALKTTFTALKVFGLNQ